MSVGRDRAEPGAGPGCSQAPGPACAGKGKAGPRTPEVAAVARLSIDASMPEDSAVALKHFVLNETGKRRVGALLCDDMKEKDASPAKVLRENQSEPAMPRSPSPARVEPHARRGMSALVPQVASLVTEAKSQLSSMGCSNVSTQGTCTSVSSASSAGSGSDKSGDWRADIVAPKAYCMRDAPLQGLQGGSVERRLELAALDAAIAALSARPLGVGTR